jgi:hypothetical protein
MATMGKELQGVNVMVTFFDDFHQFRQKILAKNFGKKFRQKIALFMETNVGIQFCHIKQHFESKSPFLGENIFNEIITMTPGIMLKKKKLILNSLNFRHSFGRELVTSCNCLAGSFPKQFFTSV